MRTTICLLGAALLLFCASPAKAGDVDATQEARTRFRRGVQLYNEGSFEAALAEFNKAYQISPNYRLLYNMAQTQFDLHDYVGAFKNLEQYAREGVNEIPEDRLVQVMELNRKLLERIGQVDVTCNLEGAEIRIDDIPVGVSPLRSAVQVNAGPRRISAIKVGHPSAVSLVTVSGKEKKKVNLTIAEAKGAERIEAGTTAVATAKQDAELVSQPGEKPSSSHTGLIASSVVAGGCAVATGVFGALALQARNDFNRELKRVPGSQDRIDDARSKMKSYALATDVLAGATLLSAGAVVYFLLTDSTESESPKSSVTLSPSVGGFVLEGTW